MTQTVEPIQSRYKSLVDLNPEGITRPQQLGEKCDSSETLWSSIAQSNVKWSVWNENVTQMEYCSRLF